MRCMSKNYGSTNSSILRSRSHSSPGNFLRNLKVKISSPLISDRDKLDSVATRNNKENVNEEQHSRPRLIIYTSIVLFYRAVRCRDSTLRGRPTPTFPETITHNIYINIFAQKIYFSLWENGVCLERDFATIVTRYVGFVRQFRSRAFALRRDQ